MKSNEKQKEKEGEAERLIVCPKVAIIVPACGEIVPSQKGLIDVITVTLTEGTTGGGGTEISPPLIIGVP